jgi:membrane protein implicated in regulation of membrane protease activity
MNWPEIYLVCFGVGTAWALVSLLLGGVHVGHFGHAHAHLHAGHQHAVPGLLAALLNPSAIAVFLAWFGGVGYLLTKYSGLLFWINLTIAVALGLAGAWILALFLRWLMLHERPMNPADYEMVGVLGRVSSTIRADGVGELIYLREGVRRLASARSEAGTPIARGEEVVVTHFDKGIAYVRTWEAMTQQTGRLPLPDSQKDNQNVQ